MDLKTFVEKHGQTGAATIIGVTQGAIWQWINGKQRITAERALEIEAATNGEVTRYDLLPTIFGPAPINGNGDGRNDGHGRDGDGDGRDGDGRFELPSSNDRRRTTLHRVDSTIVESAITDDGEEVERELSHVAVAGIGQIAAMPSQAVKAVIPLTLAATRGSAMAKVRKAREV